MNEKKNKPKPRGGAYNVKAAGEKRVYISVGLDPETIKLLAPFTKSSQRGRIIDKAVAAWFKKEAHNEKPDTD